MRSPFRLATSSSSILSGPLTSSCPMLPVTTRNCDLQPCPSWPASSQFSRILPP
ncbi:unnamed protein product [Dibothriocephalus latus]|uniref:Uncharacterized protein n=1 Tax=Dibothriocephalus latus TaxID=60516 RepID=A0A3P7MMR5_DIBLA|nr:unnamed protein product [Dibothriocephalus latus]